MITIKTIPIIVKRQFDLSKSIVGFGILLMKFYSFAVLAF